MITEAKCLCYNCFQERETPDGPCPYCGFDLAENREKYPVALPAGTVLNGRYIVGRVLGQGGFGITYLALDTQLNARVAIKEFLPGEIATRIGTTVSVMSGDKATDFTYGAERFQEEARTLAKFIGHPNIAGVSSYFNENDTSYFVMDYIEGISFKSYIANQGGKVSVDEALNVMIPVLRALTAVHAEGFIHRDVTPDNIYISKDGNVKLLDFGSARYSIGDKSKSLDVVLKVGYAPKEQYIRRGRQGPYTDVYSCAACFYAALTGYLPPESLERMDHDELVPVSQAGIDIPEWLDRAILKGLAVQPEDRFQSAQEFLDAIENQLVVDLPPQPGQAAEAPAKKKVKPAMIAGIAAAVLALVIGVGVLGGRGGSSGNGGESGSSTTPLIKSAVPSITIDGEEYSTDLRKLDLSEKGLRSEDLADLKYMVNVTDLRLGGNDITDLSPIAEMTWLKSLRLEKNELEDLSPLSGLTELEYLGLWENPNISDLSALAGMTKLAELSLPAQNQIGDLGPLANLTELEYLAMDGSWGNGTTVTDLSPLAGLTKLKQLALVVEQVEDLSPLAGLTELQEVVLTGQMNITDLSPLAGLTKLEKLQLCRNGDNYPTVFVKDLSALSSLTGLKELQLECSGLESLHGMEVMSQLRSVTLRGDSSLTDISALKGLTALETLYIYNSSNSSPYLENLDALSESTRLTELLISADGIRSLDGIKNLTNLQVLQLYGSDADITNVDALSNLARLKTLYLPSNKDYQQVMDLSGIANLTNLEEFYLYGCVSSYTPFQNLTKLKSLSLYGSYAEGTGPTDLAPLGKLKALTDLQINLCHDARDISPLGNLTNLRNLRLSASDYSQNGTALTDISPLGKLENLQTLTLTVRDVTDISPLANLKNLKSAEVRCYGQAKITDWSALDHVPNVTTS